jgi:hypothetical protein
MRNALLISLCFIAGLAGANVQPILSGAGSLIFPETIPSATLSASSGALTIAAGGTSKNVILKPTGSGCVQLFADSPAITLCDSSGQITLSAGGANQNITLTPSGTGSTLLNGKVGASTASPQVPFEVTGAAATPSLSSWNDTLALATAAGANGQVMGMGSLNAGPWGMWIQVSNKGGASFPLGLNPAGGNVGVNTISPSYSLDVSGDVNTSGVYRKGGTAGVGTGSSITVCTSGACATSCSLIFSGGIRTGGTCP